MRAAISMTPVRCAGLVRSTGASGDGGGAALAASTVDILEPVPRRFVFRLFNQDTVAIPHIARLLGWSVQSVGILHALAMWLSARKSALAGGVIFLLPTPGLKCFLVPRAYRNAV